jgi:hypothetical protein
MFSDDLEGGGRSKRLRSRRDPSKPKSKKRNGSAGRSLR